MVSVHVFFIEFLYVFIKFFRVLSCATIILLFLPYTRYRSWLQLIINSTTKNYFRFIKNILNLFGFRAKTIKKSRLLLRYLRYYITIIILNIIIKFLSKFLLFYKNKTKINI